MTVDRFFNDQYPGDQARAAVRSDDAGRERCQPRASWRARSVSSCTSARLPSSFRQKKRQIADRSCRSYRRGRENSLAPGWPTIRDDRANGATPPRDARLGMIRYALVCDQRHAFESWFANSATYDRQVKRGLVSCPVCDSTKVEKAIMAPQVAETKRRGDASVSAPMPEGPPSSQPSASKAPPESPEANVPAPVAMMSPQEREFRRKLKELREHLIRNADYVGRR